MPTNLLIHNRINFPAVEDERNERGHSVELVVDFDSGGAKALALNLSQMELTIGEEAFDGDALS